MLLLITASISPIAICLPQPHKQLLLREKYACWRIAISGANALFLNLTPHYVFYQSFFKKRAFSRHSALNLVLRISISQKSSSLNKIEHNQIKNIT